MGSVYILDRARLSIGRGEENDVILNDLRSSRKHAELDLVPGGARVRDLGSINGITINGVLTREAKIQSGDVIAFGECAVEFVTADQSTRVLTAPGRSVEEKNESIARLESSSERLRQSIGAINEGGTSPFKKVVPLLLVVVLLWLFLDQEQTNKKLPPKGAPIVANDPTRNLASFLPPPQDSDVSKKAEEYFKAGFREFVSGNYIRARIQFDTVLQIYPSHEMAHRYLEKCKNEMDRAAKDYLLRGKNALDAGRMRDAQNSFEAVVRLFYHDPENPNYQAAQRLLEDLRKKGGHS
jgi:hypothetical protein